MTKIKNLLFDPRASKIVLSIGYVIGIIGLFWKRDNPQYYKLSWVFTLFTLIVLLLHQSKQNLKPYIFLAIVGFVGWIVEAVGTNTGIVFGQYSYGSSLGFSIWGTPINMFINWMLTTYLIVMALKDKIHQPYLFTVTASAFMVFYDVLLEPFAIRFDLWHWHGGTPPLQNYAGWFIISLPLVYFLRLGLKNNTNSLSNFVLICQLLFFGIMNLLIGYFD